MPLDRTLRLCAVVLGLTIPTTRTGAQQLPAPPNPAEAARLRELVTAMKTAERGPYERLRWFCADGSSHPPQGSPCRDRGGGAQHAEPGAAARELAAADFHVGTVFQATGYEAFADTARAGYRLRELVLEHYLIQADDGWVMRRARHYRGARQVEDEERSGRALLERRFSDPGWLRSNYLLASRLAAAVPHETPGAERLMDRIRATATEIADTDPAFQPIRVRIHSVPSRADVAAVDDYLRRLAEDGALRARAVGLRDDLRAQYDPERALASLEAYEARAPADLRPQLASLRAALDAGDAGVMLDRVLSAAIATRRHAEGASDGATALDLIDLGLSLQERAFVLADQLEVETPADRRESAIRRFDRYAGLAYAAGYISARERNALAAEVGGLLSRETVTAEAYRRSIGYLSRSLDWARGTVRATFGPVLDRYALVEPVSVGFSDAVLRGSILLPLSRTLDALQADADAQLGATHTLFGNPVATGVRGLNPGVALGPLEVLDPAHPEDVLGDRVYLLTETPPELKPVAGVLTLAEGNLLSHVQLLARNLGIPNATLAPEHAARLRAARGREVFYAVTPLGRVVVAWPEALSPRERTLIDDDASEPGERVRLDTSRLRLDVRDPIRLTDLRSDASGVVVGPKAANLGQLAADFPGRVSPAVALPFGMFVAHADRPWSGSERTVLEELRAAYGHGAAMRARGATEEEIDAFMLERLAWVREAIEGLPWIPAHRARVLEELSAMLQSDFARGVFVRSDTNVEDLPQFSGAGLNLTVAHQTEPQAVLDAIKRVWTSPFSERAYLWRRQILEEQGEVYPSVLLQQTVPSEKSGVLITSGLQEGSPEDLTVVAAEGVGGAVEGEDAETLLLEPDGGVRLLSQTKAPRRREVVRGGTRWVAAGRPEVLLQDGEIAQLRSVVARLRAGSAGMAETDAVWDIEYGFVDGSLWLFQMRPFVRFRNSDLLARLAELDADATANANRPVRLNAPLGGP